MKLITRSLLWTALAFVGMTQVVQATCTGGGDPCIDPRNGTITGRTATTISLRVQNSATPNVTSSIYFFQATTLGAAQNIGTPDRNTVIVLTADFTNPALATDLIAQTVKPLLASTSYNTYAKACPPGSSQPTDAGCSAWVAIGPQTTTALTTAGFSNIASADTAPQQFTARTNASVVDQTNVIAWLTSQLSSTEVGNCSLSNSVQPFPASGATSLLITSADCNTLLPNRPYTLTEHLVYDPTQSAPNYTTTAFYTQAANPVALNPVSNITHCSARLDFQNASASPANPQDTTYSVNVGGVVNPATSAIQTRVIGGTGIFSDQNFVTYSNLQPNTPYSPTVTATNRGGASWKNSAAMPYTGFTTLSWGGVFDKANVGETTADFTTAAITGAASIATWQILLNGSAVGQPSGAGAPPATIALTGLTPNTAYSVRIRLTETSGCSSDLPTSAVTFATDPVAPTAGSLTAILERQFTANWTDASANPNTSVYEIQNCADAIFTPATCQVFTQTKVAGASQSRVISGLTPETPYFVRVMTRNVSRPTWPDSGWFTIGTATTLNEKPVVPTPVCPVTGTTANCSVNASDNGPLNELFYSWNVTPSATSIVPNNQLNNNATVVTLPSNGTYQVSVTVTDKNGTGLVNSSTVSITAGAIATSITISPLTATVATGNTKNFEATVRDQFNAVMANYPVTWSGLNSLGTLSINNSSYTVFTALTPGGPTTLTAAITGATSGTASVTVIAAGAYFVNLPVLTVNPDNRTGVVTALGADNVSGEPSISYTWSVVSGPGSVSFSPNATNPAQTATATFTKAGDYIVRCTLSNSNGSITADAAVKNVPQVLTSIRVSPAEVTVKALNDQVFTHTSIDQFGDGMSASVTWDADGGGSISQAGVFSASTSMGRSFRVTARNGSIFGSARVTVNNFDVSGAKAFPVPFKGNRDSAITFDGLGSSAKIKIYTTTGMLIFTHEETSGSYPWDLKNSSGEKVASGVYFYVIESPEGKKDGKLIIIK